MSLACYTVPLYLLPGSALVFDEWVDHGRSRISAIRRAGVEARDRSDRSKQERSMVKKMGENALCKVLQMFPTMAYLSQAIVAIPRVATLGQGYIPWHHHPIILYYDAVHKTRN